eukprot:scaffold16302_cov136-Isochrysis_galbana.AAC.5
MAPRERPPEEPVRRMAAAHTHARHGLVKRSLAGPIPVDGTPEFRSRAAHMAAARSPVARITAVHMAAVHGAAARSPAARRAAVHMAAVHGAAARRAAVHMAAVHGAAARSPAARRAAVHMAAVHGAAARRAAARSLAAARSTPHDHHQAPPAAARPARSLRPGRQLRSLPPRRRHRFARRHPPRCAARSCRACGLAAAAARIGAAPRTEVPPTGLRPGVHTRAAVACSCRRPRPSVPRRRGAHPGTRPPARPHGCRERVAWR